MSWHRVRITAADAVNMEHAKLQDDFFTRFLALGGPKQMALFAGEWDSDDGYYIYFSPQSVQPCLDLIARYNGAPCEQPDYSDLSLLVGIHDAAWHLVGDPKAALE